MHLASFHFFFLNGGMNNTWAYSCFMRRREEENKKRGVGKVIM